MRLGVLECDHVGHRHRAIAGDYADMFERLLPDASIVRYDAIGGRLPASTRECDAWLCTGSRHSVYDDLPWIADLSAFVRDVRDAGAPFVGICFGHQLLAHALGGRTARAPGGWGVGAHRVTITRSEEWMDPPLAAPTLLFMHQDQVVELPPDGLVLGGTGHCDAAMVLVGNSMLGLQAHPEFGAPYVRALIGDRAHRIGADRTAAALASLSEPTDEEPVGRWVTGFCRWVNGS